jgi:hypothetical protein
LRFQVNLFFVTVHMVSKSNTMRFKPTIRKRLQSAAPVK